MIIYYYVYNLKPVVGLYHLYYFIIIYFTVDGIWIDLNLSANELILLFNNYTIQK